MMGFSKRRVSCCTCPDDGNFVSQYETEGELFD